MSVVSLGLLQERLFQNLPLALKNFLKTQSVNVDLTSIFISGISYSVF
jgi:hypothetical protein